MVPSPYKSVNQSSTPIFHIQVNDHDLLNDNRMDNRPRTTGKCVFFIYFHKSNARLITVQRLLHLTFHLHRTHMFTKFIATFVYSTFAAFRYMWCGLGWCFIVVWYVGSKVVVVVLLLYQFNYIRQSLAGNVGCLSFVGKVANNEWNGIKIIFVI